jgi:hypothetical protein
VIYYGHGSWVVVVIFVAMFALRMIASQRRRGGRRGMPGPGRSFMGGGPYRGDPYRGGPNGASGPPPPGSTPTGSEADSTRTTGTAPGWFADPFVRHEQRYWSGTEWTEHVQDHGAPGTDPPPPDRGRRDVA